MLTLPTPKRPLIACFSALVAFCVSCEGPTQSPPPLSPAPPPPRTGLPEPPSNPLDGLERLDVDITPQRYTLELQLDPSRDSFAGHVRTDIMVNARRSWFWLHAEDLSVSAVRVEQGDRLMPATARVDDNGALLITLDGDSAVLEPGEAVLDIRYTGRVANDRHGLYRSASEDVEATLVTQLGPNYARRLLPCFDEPGMKAEFALTLRTPPGLSAYASAPLLEAHTDGQSQLWRFDTTPPIPTFLFALTVGALDDREAKGAAVPMRVLLPEARAAIDTGYIEREATHLLDYEQRYLGLAFPFAKVDLLSVEDLRPAAMENVGLITFDPWILTVSAESSLHNRRTALWIVAHELAHQWFGNLVGMVWWSDVWLHESTATWLANRALEGLYDDLELWRRRLHRLDASMRADASPDALPLTPDVRSRASIFDAYTTQVYHKGSALLETLELWLCASSVQATLQDFLSEHRYTRASSTDFITALERHADPAQPVAEVVSDFLRTPGVPHIRMAWSCAGDSTHLTLEQHHLTSPDTLWTLPICVELRDDTWSDTACLLLREASQDFTLEGCLEAIHPNAGYRGYYRWSMNDDAWSALVDHGVDASDWSWWLAHHEAFIANGDAEMGHLLSQLPRLLEFATASGESGLEGAALELAIALHRAFHDEPLWKSYIERVVDDSPDASLAAELGVLTEPPVLPDLDTLRVSVFELQRLANAHENDPDGLLELLEWARRDPERLRRMVGADLYVFRGLCSPSGRAGLLALAETLSLEDAPPVLDALSEVDTCVALRGQRAELQDALR